MKTLKNGPQKLLIIDPKLFFTVLILPGCPNQPRSDFSYYKYVPRLIWLLICDLYHVRFIASGNTTKSHTKF